MNSEIHEISIVGDAVLASASIGSNGFLLKSSLPSSTIKKASPVLSEDKFNALKYMPWGKNNLWPQDILKDVRKSDLILSLIDWKAKEIYADGIRYGFLHTDDNGQQQLQPIQDDEIDDWLLDSDFNAYLEGIAKNDYLFGNPFAHLIFNNEANPKIVMLKALDSSQVRLHKQNKSGIWKGHITKAVISSNWESFTTTELKNDPYSKTIASISPHFPVHLQLGEKPTKKQYAYPLSGCRLGNVHYKVPEWHGIRESGWLDLAFEIPNFKRRLIQNMISPKYHIEVNSMYWVEKYGTSFKDKPEAEKKRIVKAELNLFLNNMSGSDKAGNAIITPFSYSNQGKEEHGWIVKELKGNIESGAYIEDSQEVDFHTIRAFGIHPTLIGVNSKNGLGAGSGSDQRIARINYSLGTKSDLDRYLKPLHLVAKYNGWQERFKNQGRLTFWTQKYYAATLDLGDEPKAKKETPKTDSHAD